jgi:predicted TIM-barrel fold metal-dependent hydrolase
MNRIDCQSHIFPRPYAEILTHNRAGVRACANGDHYMVDYGVQQFHIDLEQYSLERKIADMDRAGIDAAILSVNIPGPEWLDAELRCSGAVCCNDALAEACARYPGRFAGLAALPLPDVAEALNELERAATRLDLRGVVMYSHYQGKPIDSPDFELLFARLEQLNLPIVLHPTVPTWAESIRDYSMIPMFGFMVDTSIAMLRLILSGVMERYPNLNIVHPHAGGVLPYLMGRVVEQTEVKKRGRENITQSPADYYARVYLDLVSPSAQAIAYARDFSGVERLLFGSDHPWVEPGIFINLIESLDWTPSERSAILSENAIRLFRL